MNDRVRAHQPTNHQPEREIAMTNWTLDDRVELTDWQPTDRVWLAEPGYGSAVSPLRSVAEPPRDAMPSGKTDREREAEVSAQCVHCLRWRADIHVYDDGSTVCESCRRRAAAQCRACGMAAEYCREFGCSA